MCLSALTSDTRLGSTAVNRQSSCSKSVQKWVWYLTCNTYGVELPTYLDYCILLYSRRYNAECSYVDETTEQPTEEPSPFTQRGIGQGRDGWSCCRSNWHKTCNQCYAVSKTRGVPVQKWYLRCCTAVMYLRASTSHEVLYIRVNIVRTSTRTERIFVCLLSEQCKRLSVHDTEVLRIQYHDTLQQQQFSGGRVLLKKNRASFAFLSHPHPPRVLLYSVYQVCTKYEVCITAVLLILLKQRHGSSSMIPLYSAEHSSARTE